MSQASPETTSSINSVYFVYFDALKDGGYPRDIRWLAGALANSGLDVKLITKNGSQYDGLGTTELLHPAELTSRFPSGVVVHVWGLFSAEQLRWGNQKRPEMMVLSPLAHLMRSHLRRRAWKKWPYVSITAALMGRQEFTAHLFSEQERNLALSFFRPNASFIASVGLFSVPDTHSRKAGDGDYLLFLGRNDVHQKGIDMLLESYHAAAQCGLELPLMIAGRSSGNSDDWIRSRINQLGLAECVCLKGAVNEDEKWQVLRNARALVFLSRWDGPPRPVREALSAGVPVIVSPGTNMGDLVEASGAGRCTAFQIDSVIKALMECQNVDTVARWALGVGHLQDKLRWSEVAKTYIEGYRLAAGSFRKQHS